MMRLGAKLGVCIKDNNRAVLFQNDCAMGTCGNQSGTVCGKACMSLYHQMEECSAVSEGMKLFKNVDIDGKKVDAMIVNDGNQIVTFLYPLSENEDKIKKQAEFFEQRGLTRSECKIMQMVLQGMSNAQIAEQLFISKATLKTHLNNAYKKLPSSMRPSQIRA